MQIQGLQKLTLLDYPGRTACTVFLSGCNFRCPFCHNAPLLTAADEDGMDEDELLAFLKKRQGLLDGVAVTGGEPLLRPELPALLEKIKARPDAQLLQTVMLRSLRQAIYSPENVGHFGLSYEHYTHFTSPIRRYPDLLVHRAIRSVIRSKRETKHVQRAGAASMPKARIYPYDEAALEKLGEQCSMTERRADEATRDVVNWLKCEFMQDRVGEIFEGVITAATGFGIFVELKDIYVEGLVHVTALPADYYHFDPVHHRLAGERSGRSFRLGDSVAVKVMRVDLDERKIEFELSEGKTDQASAGRGRGGDSRKKSPARSAGAGNTDVQKSRDVKKALLDGAKKGGGKAPAGKKPSAHRKGAPKSGAAPAGGKPSGRKAKR